MSRQSRRASDPGHVALARHDFGTTADGRRVELFVLTNAGGMEVRLLTYGGIVQSIRAPDRLGLLENVSLGYRTLAEYERDTHYLGVICGRYANRIARGRFTLDGSDHQLDINDEPNHLHGGPMGFHRAVWQAEPFEQRGGVGVVLSHTSRDGDQRYPGTVQAQARVTLTGDNALCFEFHATTDRPTPVNLAQHSYFNLSDGHTGDILAHELTIHAERYTPVDGSMIPTGELRSVAGTPFDFRTPQAVGSRIAADDEQLRFGRGYDHNFALEQPGDGEPVLAARLLDPLSGRSLEIHTTQPGLQFYSGNSLGRKEGSVEPLHGHRSGLALEAQHFPDSPNRPEFPGTILRPGEQYSHSTIYRFGWT